MRTGGQADHVRAWPGRWLVSCVRDGYAGWPLAAEHVARITAQMRGYETMKTRLAINWINDTPQLRRSRCPMLGIVGDYSPRAVRGCVF